MTDRIVDPIDGLVAGEVGIWTLEKHRRLQRYIDISRAVRRKFNNQAGATYVELHCGTGRAFVRETRAFIDGSPLVAFSAAYGGSQFSEMHLADIDDESVSAVQARLKAKGATAIHAYVGEAGNTVEQICKTLNPHALHFAFLDPYKLDLPFSVIQRLAGFERMDMLIHVSAMDFQRNLRRYIEDSPSPLDGFAPGWREFIDLRERDELVRQKILVFWLSLIRKLDMQPSQGIELVTGSNNQPLYWLVFVARHPLAGKFWDEIRKVDSQSNMF